MAFQVSVLVSEELYASVSGKLVLSNVFNTDINIIGDTMLVGQLVFFFMMESDLEEQPKGAITLQVTLPGEEPLLTMVPVNQVLPQEGRTRWLLRYPVTARMVTLRPGRIETKVIHDRGETSGTGVWVVPMPQKAP